MSYNEQILEATLHETTAIQPQPLSLKPYKYYEDDMRDTIVEARTN